MIPIGAHIFVRFGKDECFAWSSICDAPLTTKLTDAEAMDYMRTASSGADTFRQRWQRLKKLGTTDLIYVSAEDTVRVNRAGPNEECLKIEALRRAYNSAEAQGSFEPTIDDIETFASDRILDGETVESVRKEMEQNLPRNPNLKLYYEALIRDLTTAESHQ